MTLLTVGLAAGAIAPWLLPSSVFAQQNSSQGDAQQIATQPTATQATATQATSNPQTFPDIQEHWARPFIESLAQADIVRGYPDGTYRPNQAMTRDEFSALVRQAFDRERERQIASGSTFTDVPEDYWAERAIQEAYEQGFVNADPNGQFRPREPIARVDAIATLATVVEPVSGQTAQATQPQASPSPAASTTAQAAPAQTASAPRQRRQQAMPLAFGALLQPFITPRVAQAATALPAQVAASVAPVAQPSPAASPEATAQASPAVTSLATYYDDADRIPETVAQATRVATQSGIVVNHPNIRLLEPQQPTTRGDAAAFVHQALVNRGQLQPLPQTVAAAEYVVRPE
ncbi:MAG: S-layer homology domain-containing protein [Oculatellaceae cyanobacterium Prado106]|nr:S-layer homology domain-containing protein [Oculatellaceae cyanobacterium Prado106]